MEDNIKTIETLLERTADYGKVSFELVKLKVLDKTSDEVSSFLSRSIVIVILTSFTLFLNLGAAIWIGKILGEMFYGFFVVAAFYAVIAFIMHFFMHKWLKRKFNDYIIRLFSKQTDKI